MNSFNKFNEEQLPKKENFYSHLYEEHITDKDYKSKHYMETF